MYIFWDNSNIHYSGLNLVFPQREPGNSQELFRTNFRNLFEVCRNDREVAGAFIVGSIPPEDDGIWDYIRSLGITLELLERSAKNKEIGVDETLQTRMLRLLLDTEPSTIAVLTGDGAGSKVGRGFLSDLERAHKMGWKIEVYSWDASCNKKLKSFAETHGTYIPLEDFYNVITFIKNNRWSIDIN